MNVVSNQEFVKLVEGRSNQLRSLARKRAENDPSGYLVVSELENIMKVAGSTPPADRMWLQKLYVMATSGRLARIRQGHETWEDHVAAVHVLHAQSTIPFDINDHVILKDTGKSGMVGDYNPDTKEYVVFTNPFQMAIVPADKLLKGE